ncbi:hypothetical protein KUCAC02_022477, partial [Chaenocephalus aceratus]
TSTISSRSITGILKLTIRHKSTIRSRFHPPVSPVTSRLWSHCQRDAAAALRRTADAPVSAHWSVAERDSPPRRDPINDRQKFHASDVPLPKRCGGPKHQRKKPRDARAGGMHWFWRTVSDDGELKTFITGGYTQPVTSLPLIFITTSILLAKRRGETLSEGTVSALMEWLAKAWGQMGRGGRRKRKRGRKGEGVGGSKRSPHLESLQVSPGPGHER